jgi:hypothetical protein
MTSVYRWGGWSAPRPGRFTPGKDPVPIVQEVGWAPGPVWTGAENLAPTGIRSPDRPARRESLYRLSYPGPLSFPTGVNEIRFTHVPWNLWYFESKEGIGKTYVLGGHIVQNVKSLQLSQEFHASCDVWPVSCNCTETEILLYHGKVKTK